MENKITNKKYLVPLIFVFFGLLYAAISLVNHYHLRTYALDLGVFNQALNSLSNFQAPIYTLDLMGNEYSFFSDHFSPIIVFFTPMYFIFGSWTMLIGQIGFVLIGAWGVYKYAGLKSKNLNFQIIMLLQFMGIWGIYSALSFDAHANVIGAMLVPWLLYYYEIKNKKWVIIITLLILMTKENMALWLFFIFLGLMFKNGIANYKTFLKFEIPMAIFTFIYFIVILKFVMPLISEGNFTNHLNRYSQLGNSLGEIILTIIKEPHLVFSLLFENLPSEHPLFGIKSELHFMILVSGGIAFFYKPYYALMLIPIYAQKLLTNDFVFHGISYQYSIEFVPILSFAIIDAALRFKTIKKQLLFIGAFAISTHLFNLNSLDHRKSIWFDSTQVRFYQKKHYQSIHTIKDLKEIQNIIPKETIISAQSKLLPHFCNRTKVYLFPVIKDAKYILIDITETNTYPLDKAGFDKEISNLKTNGSWEILYEKEGGFMVFKRK